MKSYKFFFVMVVLVVFLTFFFAVVKPQFFAGVMRGVKVNKSEVLAMTVPRMVNMVDVVEEMVNPMNRQVIDTVKGSRMRQEVL